MLDRGFKLGTKSRPKIFCFLGETVHNSCVYLDLLFGNQASAKKKTCSRTCWHICFDATRIKQRQKSLLVLMWTGPLTKVICMWLMTQKCLRLWNQNISNWRTSAWNDTAELHKRTCQHALTIYFSMGFYCVSVCVCSLSLALVLPQYSMHYIKAKIDDTITQAKCKCHLHHFTLLCRS